MTTRPRPREFQRAARSLLLVTLALLAATHAATQQPAAPSNLLLSLRMVAEDSAWRLEAISSGPIELAGLQIDPDRTVVVQLPRHRQGPELTELFPEDGPVASVRVSVTETAAGPLTRLLVRPREPVVPALTLDGTAVHLRLADPDAEAERAQHEERWRQRLDEALRETRDAESRAAELERQLTAARDELAAAQERQGALERRTVEAEADRRELERRRAEARSRSCISARP